MLRKKSKEIMALILAVMLVIATIPLSFANTAEAKSGLLLNANFGGGDSIDTGSPVKDNAVVKSCGGVNAATIDQLGKGTLTYHFTDLKAVGKASVLLSGRAIMGATVDVKVKAAEADEWTLVATLGTEEGGWGVNDTVLYDLSKTVEGATDFYFQLVFNDGQCGDWASVNRVRVATIAKEDLKTSGTVIDSDFAKDSWIAEAENGAYFRDWEANFPNALTIIEAGHTRDKNVNAEVVYHLTDLDAVETMVAYLNVARKIMSGPYIEVLTSADGAEYTSAYKTVDGTDVSGEVKIDLTAAAAGKTELYVKLVIHETSMGDWIAINSLKVVSTTAEESGSTPAPEPDPEPTPTPITLLDVNFNDDGAMEEGTPTVNNIDTKDNGGAGLPYGATVAEKGVGSLTYQFTNDTQFETAQMLIKGRAIIGANIIISVKKADGEWQQVTKLGGESDWSSQDVGKTIDLSEYVKESGNFELKFDFDDGACGDWAMINALLVTATANDVPAGGTTPTPITLLDVNFNDEGAMEEGTPTVNNIDTKDNGGAGLPYGATVAEKGVGSLTYQFTNDTQFETAQMLIKGRAIIGANIIISVKKADGEWQQVTKLGGESDWSSQDVGKTIDLSEYVKESGSFELKFDFDDGACGDWAMINALLVTATANDVPAGGTTPTPTPDENSFTEEVFAANTITGSEIAKNENWDENLVASNNVSMQTSAGWNGTAGNTASPHDSRSALYANSGEGGYAIFKLPLAEGKQIETLKMVFNGRYCNDLFVTLSISDKQDSGYIDIYTTSNDTSGKDQEFDVTEKAKGWTEVYVKATFPPTNCPDWSALWNIRAIGTTADAVTTPESDSFTAEIFEANGMTVAGGNITATTKNENWDENLVASNNVSMQTSAGWNGTAGNTASPHDSRSALYANSGEGGYAIFKLPLAEGKQIETLKLIFNGRYCNNLNVSFEISDKQDGTYTQVFETTEATTGKDQEIDVTLQTKDWTEVYVKAVFPPTNCPDWSALWNIRAIGTTVDAPVVDTTIHEEVFAANDVTLDGTNITSTTKNENWDKNLVASSNVSMQTAAGWFGTAGNTASPHDSRSALYASSNDGGYAIFKLPLAEGRQIENLKLTFNGRWCGDFYVSFAISNKQDGTYETVYTTTSETSGKDQEFDVTKQTKGWKAVYIKAIFPSTMCIDWSALWNIRATGDTVEATADAGMTLLDVNFNNDGSLAEGDPLINNIDTKDNGGAGLPYGATVAEKGKGSLTYQFTNDTQFDTAKLDILGRAIIGANITVSVKKKGYEWQTVTKLGGGADWGSQDKATSIDLTEFVKGCGSFELEFYFDDGACGDWAMINALLLTATTNGLAAEDPSEEDGVTIFEIDYSKDNWQEQYPIHEISNMIHASFDGGRGIMPAIREGEACACDTGYVIYKVENVNPQDLVLYANHRSMNGVAMNFQFSKDGRNFATIVSSTDNRLNANKPLEVELGQAALGATTFYIKVEVPGNMCNDWAALTYLKLVNKPTELQQEYLLDVDYSRDDWKDQYTPESVEGLASGQYEYSYQVFKQGVYSNGSANPASVVYKINNASGANALKLLLNNRGCNSARTIVSVSMDGSKYEEIAVVSTDNLDLGKPYDLDLGPIIGDSDSFYLKLELPADGLADWNVLVAAKVLKQVGNVKVYYRLQAKSNAGGSVEVTEKVEAGKAATARAVTASGNVFKGWYNYDGDLLSTDATYTFVPNGNETLIARFFKPYTGAGTVVLESDYNDITMGYLADAYDYDNIASYLDDGMKVQNLYGQELVRADSGVIGTITYKFENLGELKNFKAVAHGRAIMKATMDFQVSSNGSIWETVRSLGGPTAEQEMGYSYRELEFIDYVKDLDTFYIKIVFNISGLQDWIALRSLTFVANGDPADEFVMPEFEDGAIGNVANENRDGKLLDQDITYEDYLDNIFYINNMYIKEVEGKDGQKDEALMVMDKSYNGDVIWKFDNLKPLTKFLMTFNGQAINDGMILLRVSTDGQNWQVVSGGRLDSVNSTKFDLDTPVTIDLTSRAEHATELYVRAMFTATNSNTDVYLTNISAESEGDDAFLPPVEEKPDDEEDEWPGEVPDDDEVPGDDADQQPGTDEGTDNNEGADGNQKPDSDEDDSELPDTGVVGILWLMPIIALALITVYASRKVKKAAK